MMKFPRPFDKVLPNEIKLERTPHYHKKDDVCTRIVGSLVGLAVSDALGASVEFRPRQYLVANPIRKMEGGGTWGLDAGKWTDDTSMALCLASSLITENGYNAYDQMVRYKWWFKYGYLSSTGNCFDIGKATRQSLIDFSTRQKVLKINYRCRSEYEVDTLTKDSVERTDPTVVNCGAEDSAGNGALMRLAPVPLFYFDRPDIAVKRAGDSAVLTHANTKAIDACRYYAALIVGALRGFSKDQLLDNNFYSKNISWFDGKPLHEDIKSIAEGSYKRKGGYEDGIRGKGYVVNALEAALWAFWSDNDSFEQGALAAVNLGDDTDTTAAIYGQLAGAHYGYEKIPKDWITKLYAHDLIVCIGEWLHFQGRQHGSKSCEDQYVSETEIKKSDEQMQQQNVTALTTSGIDHSKVPEIKHNSRQSIIFSKQHSIDDRSGSKPNSFNRTLSVDATTNASTTHIVSPKDSYARISSFKLTKNDDPREEDSIHENDHPFYPKKSSEDLD